MGNFSLGNVGRRDLDGRPTLIMRSSVYLWIQRCLSCGYCAPEIAKGNKEDGIVVQTEAYREQLCNSSFPETANAFLCHSIIMQNRKQYADAAWATKFASWICEDTGYVENAHRCRGDAIALFLRARENGEEFASTRDQEQIYLIDLYRRRSRFDIASQLCDEELEKEHEDHLLDIIYFERELIDKKDAATHSDSEAEDTIL